MFLLQALIWQKQILVFLVNEVQSRAAGSILDVADKSFADGVLTVKAKAGEAFSLKNKKYAVALQVQNDAQTALSTYHLLTSPNNRS